MLDSIKKYAGLLICILISIIFYHFIQGIDEFKIQLGKFISILMPFIWAFAIAYLLNPLMVLLERKYKLKRWKSLIACYIFLIGLLTLFILILIPIIIENLVDIIEKIPYYTRETENFINEYLLKISIVEELNLYSYINDNMNDITTQILELLNLTLQGVMGMVFSFTSSIVKFILGIIISVYMLFDKERFVHSIKKLIVGVFGHMKASKIIKFASEVNEIFYNFFIGKAIDSFIIGILAFIGLSILKAPYATLMSLIVGVFNMIPYFGPFIGAVPAVLFALLSSPIKAVWVTLFIFALQQFDGIILGPKILGDKVGISPFYIILAIMIGGGYFGMVGMLFAVPVFKIIDIVLNRFLDKRIKFFKDELKIKVREE